MAAAAYYNEIDPYAAQWLRNLTSSPGQQADSSFDPAAYGKSGTAPRPFRATSCSRQICADQASHTRACAQSRSRGFRRTLRSTEARLDSASRNGGSDCRGQASLWSWPGRWLPLAVDAHGTTEPTLRYWPFDRNPNTATCCAVLDRWETMPRTDGKYDHQRRSPHHWLYGTQLCNAPSSTCDGNAMAAALYGIGRTSACVRFLPFAERT